MNERVHGNNYVPDELIFKRDNVFNGYQVSLLSIKYLNGTLDFDCLVETVKDNNKIRKLGNLIIGDMISYYKERYNTKKNVK